MGSAIAWGNGMKHSSQGRLVAVIICVHSGVALAHWKRALDSLRSQTLTSQRWLVFIDGYVDDSYIDSLAEEPRPIGGMFILNSEKSVGLAEGLNRLIDKALEDAAVEFVARMDSDDVSLPLRFEAQCRFLEAHTDVGVLGTACEEFDEDTGSRLLKVLPEHHEDLLSFMTVRSPFIHPTVMFRRKVLESGARYNGALRLMQDYDLWARLALAGVRFANLPFPHLLFRTSEAALARRRGLRRAVREVGMRWSYARATGRLSLVVVGKLLAFGLLRCSPAVVTRLAYRRLR